MALLNKVSQTYSTFLLEIKALNERISELFSLSNGSEKDQLIKEIGDQIRDLNDTITKSVSLFPSYENRLLKEQLNTLYMSYTSLKKNAQPKLHFSFKISSEMGYNKDESKTQNDVELVSNLSSKPILSLSETEFLHIKKRIHLYKKCNDNQVNISNALLCIYLVHESGWHSLNARYLKDSFVLANDICGPVCISDCQDCTFIIFCYQFRMHNCKNVNVLITCKSKPIIENCIGIRFGPNPYNKDTSETWCEVQDFGWLKQNKSPNWDIISEKDRWDINKWEEIIHDAREIPNIINLIHHK
ncbi:hypothetical protein PORY_001808 [Pneumocystis oryctolagi]|uniref:Uncharacterized protein n=1 Tax=Pneumocystis oryctolagi TaxID=42067 RepID=A0ACB7CBI2_9ASCO|nr:hypothetical protein PORY_001808 [Pneumocystis oryctolagi]